MYLIKDRPKSVLLDLQVVASLQVHPEPLRGPEVTSQAQRRVNGETVRERRDWLVKQVEDRTLNPPPQRLRRNRLSSAFSASSSARGMLTISDASTLTLSSLWFGACLPKSR